MSVVCVDCFCPTVLDRIKKEITPMINDQFARKANAPFLHHWNEGEGWS